MFAFPKEHKKPTPTLTDFSDEDLVTGIIEMMWTTVRSKNKNSLIPELEKYYNEACQRGKPHLWNRAKDCFEANWKNS